MLLAKFVGLGAMYAAFISAICVTFYTIITTFSYNGFFETSLFSTIFLANYRVVDDLPVGALIVLFTKFVVCFGIFWGPITIWLYKKHSKKDEE